MLTFPQDVVALCAGVAVLAFMLGFSSGLWRGVSIGRNTCPRLDHFGSPIDAEDAARRGGC